MGAYGDLSCRISGYGFWIHRLRTPFDQQNCGGRMREGLHEGYTSSSCSRHVEQARLLGSAYWVIPECDSQTQ